MIRSRRLIKSTQQLKEEQINFLLEDIEKNLKEYNKALALRDNQIAKAKKYFRALKKAMIQLCKKIISLKNKLKYKKRYQEHLQRQKPEEFSRQQNYFQFQPPPKNIKKYITKN